MKNKSQIPLLKDPETGSPSVSFSLLIFALIGIVAVGVLELVGKISKVGIFEELFYSAVALYFGRRWTGSKSKASSTKTVDDSETKEEL